MTEKKKPGRKPHQPTDETRAIVEALASFGVNQDAIGDYLGGLCDDTVRKYYSDIFAQAKLKKNLKVADFLYGAATGAVLEDPEKGATYADCVRAAMFYLKTQANWSEKSEVDVKSSDGSMSPASTLDASKLSTETLREIMDAAKSE